MGLDIYLHSRGDEGNLDHSVKSALHPENICTPNYLRSSYNSAGFNQAVPKWLDDAGASLYGIFEPLIGNDTEGYSFEVTDPGKVLLVQERARSVARRLRALKEPLSTMTVDNWHHPGMSEVDAMKWTQGNLDRAATAEEDYLKWGFSSKEGVFDPQGMLVHGVTFGKRGEVILVIRAVREDGTPWTDSYADSAEIVAEEFCQTMLDYIESEGGCTLLWSA